MEIRFTSDNAVMPSQRSHRCGNLQSKIWDAVCLIAMLAAVLATLEWLHLLPFGLVGVAVTFVPSKYRKFLWLALAAFALIRFGAVWNGTKILANRLFWLSEQTQSYEYSYFIVKGESCAEAVVFLSLLAGMINFPAILAGLWAIAMAYFGITPNAIWLALLLLAGLISALPRQHRWFYSLVVSILVLAIAFAAANIAPEPSKAVSELDEQLRDRLTIGAVTYEQKPIPTEVPEPEIVPQPETELQQPDHGVQQKIINILFMILAALTLALLFIPAVIKDRAEKRSEQARAGFDDPDHAVAIKAMYLYTQRWRKLSDSPMEIPVDVYAIWQEAVYSDHAMTAEQKEIIHSYMVETAYGVWNAADKKKQMYIRYRVCL